MSRDEPNQHRIAEYMKQIRKHILESGWMVQGVFAAEGQEGTNFAYTIGLTDAGLPELLITGNLNPRQLQILLNEAGLLHVKNEIMPGDVVEDIATVALRARKVDDVTPLQQALNFYHDPHNQLGKVRAVQLIWPDTKGAYPDSMFYDPEMPQPLH